MVDSPAKLRERRANIRAWRRLRGSDVARAVKAVFDCRACSRSATVTRHTHSKAQLALVHEWEQACWEHRRMRFTTLRELREWKKGAA